ncbi:MAG TPA: WhiB family transcriptional regulator [Actinomycetota bacterium]|nr:WhiB family transcriptional regulator [Actinomycetota bacterium]
MKNDEHPTNKTKTTKALASKLASLEAEARWQDRAACKGMDPTIFFGPEHTEVVKEKRDREEAAKAVCRTCPVNQECLEHALDSKEAYGIWGGLTELERKALLRRRATSSVVLASAPRSIK